MFKFYFSQYFFIAVTSRKRVPTYNLHFLNLFIYFLEKEKG